MPANWLKQIETVAKKLGSNRCRIMAFATLKFVEHAENNGVVTVPPNWSEIFKSHGNGVKQKSRLIPGSKIKSPKVR